VFNGLLDPDGLRNILTTTVTNGYVDEHGRFVNASTVVVAEVSKQEAKHCGIAKVNRERMKENVEIFKQARNQDEKAK